MSGGLFEYKQYAIDDMIDSIERELNNEEKMKYLVKEPPEVLETIYLSIKKLQEAQIYAHRVDWFLSGDDGADSFLKRLNEDLEKSKKENKW